MKTLAFLVILGGTFGVAQAAGASFGLATGLAWGAALLSSLLFHYAGSAR